MNPKEEITKKEKQDRNMVIIISCVNKILGIL